MICWDPRLLIRGDFLCCSPRVTRSAPLFLFCLFQDESGDSLLVSGDLTLFSCSPPSAGSDEASGGDHRVQNLELLRLNPRTWSQLPGTSRNFLLFTRKLCCLTTSVSASADRLSTPRFLRMFWWPWRMLGRGLKVTTQRFLLFLRTYRCSVFQSNSFRKLK